MTGSTLATTAPLVNQGWATESAEVIIPLGLPIGRTFVLEPGSGGGEKVELSSIRRGGRLVTIDGRKYAVWQAASMGRSREELALHVARELRLATFEVFDTIGDLIDARVCMRVSGSQEERWAAIADLRAVPRGYATGRAYEGEERYGIRLPDGAGVVWLSQLAFFVWSFWDGRLTLVEAVEAVEADSKAQVEVLQRCSVELAVAALKLGLVFLDPRDKVK